MNHIDILLSKNIIPIVQHQSYWFNFAASEAQKAAHGLVPEMPVNFFVAKSSRRNAFSFKVEQEYFVIITSGLFELVEKSIVALLNTEAVRQFFRDWMHVDYQVNISIPKEMTWAAAPPGNDVHGPDSAWFAVFNESFEWALIFILLHEMAHIKFGHVDGNVGDIDVSSADLYGKTVQAIELMTYGGAAENRFTRYSEYSADRESAGWLFQLVMREGVRNPAAGRARIGLASFGLLVTILHISRHREATEELDQSFDHVSFEARLESAWEGIDFALNDVLTPASVSFNERMITKQRSLIETLVLGAPSNYWISI